MDTLFLQAWLNTSKINEQIYQQIKPFAAWQVIIKEWH